MSSSDQKRFLAALAQTMARTTPGQLSFYENLAERHNRLNDVIHNDPIFLPWHRYFLYDLEYKLQDYGPITIPYWQWDYDSQAPELSPIWRSDAFGGNGRGSNACVQDGYFATFRPPAGCLQRRFSSGNRVGTLGAFESTEVLNSIINRYSNHDDFRQALEYAPHGRVHTNIGGHMETMRSPTDPIFFLHHANIDRMYTNWQRIHPMSGYSGRGRSGRSVAPEDQLPGYSRPVSYALNIKNLCYTYEDMRVENGLPVQALPKPEVPQVQFPVPQQQQIQQQAVQQWQNVAQQNPQQQQQPMNQVQWQWPQQQQPQPQQQWNQPQQQQQQQGWQWQNGQWQWNIPQQGMQNNNWFMGFQSPQAQSPVTPQPVWNGFQWVWPQQANQWRRLVRRMIGQLTGLSPPRRENRPTTDAYMTVNTYKVMLPVVNPVDGLVSVKPGLDDMAKTIPSHDRKHLLHLRTLDSIDEKWLQRNNIPVQDCRKHEEENRVVIHKVNAVPGYVSPTALWNRVDCMEALVVKEPAFVAHVNGTTITVESPVAETVRSMHGLPTTSPNTARGGDSALPPLTDQNMESLGTMVNAKQIVSDVRARIKESVLSAPVQQPVDVFKSALWTIIGPPVLGAECTANPYRARRQNEKGYGPSDS
jgi:tyrosinase